VNLDLESNLGSDFDEVIYDSQKLGLGVIGEKVSCSFLSSTFKVRDGYKIIHNDFKNYTKSITKGVDLRLFKENREIARIECKNWRQLDRPYDKDIAFNEVVKRFEDTPNGTVKVLIISFQVFTQEALELIEAHGITVIWLNRLMGKGIFRSQTFYDLRDKTTRIITKLLNKPKPEPPILDPKTLEPLVSITPLVSVTRLDTVNTLDKYVYDNAYTNKQSETYNTPTINHDDKYEHKGIKTIWKNEKGEIIREGYTYIWGL